MSLKDRCEECLETISQKRLVLMPFTRFCTQCQSEQDVFKYKMKAVGFDDEAKIAKNKKDWDLLKKQKRVKDI